MKKIFLLTMLLASLLSGCDEAYAQDIYVPTRFLDLDDTPADYSGHANDCVVVKATEDGTEFGSCASGNGGSDSVVTIQYGDVTIMDGTLTIDFSSTYFESDESPTDEFNVAIKDIFAFNTGDTLSGAYTFTGTVEGTFAGDGNGITNINGENIAADTIDDDSIDFGTSTDQVSASDMPNEDLGDVVVSGGAWTLDNDVVAAAEMADADHGDISWSSGVASVDANAVALGTDTTGGYAASTTEGGGATSLEADAVDALTEIAQSIKTAANDTSALVVGTAGSNGELGKWNTDGTMTDANVILGTMTDGKWCSYSSSGTVLSCTQDAPAGSGDMTATGNCTSGDAFTGSCGTTLASNTDIIVDLDEDNNGTETFQIRNGANTLVAEIDELGGLTINQVNLGSDEAIQFPAATITETGSDLQFSGADVEIIDDLDLIFGTNEDWKIQYDEGVDNQLLFITANTSAIATTDPMFEILVGTTPTADQQVFGVSKGTQATNTPLLSLDEDGDMEIPGTMTIGGALACVASGSCTGYQATVTAGRSLTFTGATLDNDVEVYTDEDGIYFEDPTASDDFKTIFVAPVALTIINISCESDQTVNFDLQVDDGSATGVNGSDIACTTFATDSSLAGDVTMAAGDRLDLAVTSVSGTPTWVAIHWEYTYDD